MTLSPRVRRILGAVAFCVLVVVARVSYDSSRNYREGRALEAAGEAHEAAVRYGRAIHMYVPMLPVPAMASDRLVALAGRATAPEEARFCWEELRSGWLAVRSLWQPGAEYVAQAEEAIAALILRDPAAAWPDPTLPPERRRAVVRDRLAEREDPNRFWVIVMGAGWCAWLAGAGLAIARGIPKDDDDPLHWPTLGRWALVSAAGYVVWLIALALA